MIKIKLSTIKNLLFLYHRRLFHQIIFYCLYFSLHFSFFPSHFTFHEITTVQCRSTMLFIKQGMSGLSSVDILAKESLQNQKKTVDYHQGITPPSLWLQMITLNVLRMLTLLLLRVCSVYVAPDPRNDVEEFYLI